MVSRSLEKMMLIAVGLTAVVIVGVPILMFSIETLNTSTRLSMADQAADQLLNATRRVDTGELNSTVISIRIPSGVTVSADGYTLTVLFEAPDGTPTLWSGAFTHLVEMDPITQAGEYHLSIMMDTGVVTIVQVTPAT
jgi:hypothetical protein